MRIKAIRLEWFRGAASAVELPAKGKSIAIYGANGAGKSSFVDGLEYMLCAGRIGHLTHEYSGKKQEKGVINTHKPTLQPTSVTIEFVDGKTATAVVETNGAFALSGDGLGHLYGLDYRRLVLRQDEVAAFIRSPKGEKYSALLPLLGLEQLEASAEAVRQLSRSVDRSGGLTTKQQELNALAKKVGGLYSTIAALEAKVEIVHGRHRDGVARENSLLLDCRALQQRIRERLEAFAPDVQRYEALRRVVDNRPEELVIAVKDRKAALAGASIALLRERLEVVAAIDRWLASAGGNPTACPACGQTVTKKDMEAHVAAEKKSLDAGRHLLDTYKEAVDQLRQSLTGIESAVYSTVAKSWLEARSDQAPRMIQRLRELARMRGDAIADTEALQSITDDVIPLVEAAHEASKQPPPDTRELLEDFQAVEAGEAFLSIGPLLREIRGIQQTTTHLDAVQRSIRIAIRDQADAAIAVISKDVQRMWAILHPGKEIEDIRLRHPDEADKAIDIELKFFGVDLKSPRLTLSEGNRNSLGLCVFLAMALHASGDQPVVLDDVVVSLDREHRGMIVELLEKEFADRQVILLNHDRDWFAELRQFLDKGWQHLALRPYREPQDGIAWSDRVAAFDDARAQVPTTPDAAGNTARKIMDTELALVADRLKVPMEFRQGLKNDHRMAHEFLEALAKASAVAFQRQTDKKEYVPSDDLARLLREADKLVVAWGNKGSHSFDVVKAEATKLIDKCEEALKAFTCPTCGKAIWKFEDAGAEVTQCGCGATRWKYGKLG